MRSISAMSMPETNRRTSLRSVTMQKLMKKMVVRSRYVCFMRDTPTRSRKRTMELRNSTTMVQRWRS